MRSFTLESKPFIPPNATLDGRGCWVTPNLVPIQPCSKTQNQVRLWLVIG
jgi:hypothetical protein